MFIAIHGVKLNAHCYTWNEAFVPIAIHEVDKHGVKLYACCFTWSEASCSMLYME